MEIDRFEYYPNDDVSKNPTVFGLNIHRQYGQTFVNLFDLDENEGELVSDNFLDIFRDILKKILLGENIENVNWSFSSGCQTSVLKFSTLNGQPFKLDVSNRHAAEMERANLSRFGLGWSIDRYMSEYEEQPPNYIMKDMERIQDPSPQSVFMIPCKNPAAKDGFFYCQPSYYGSDVMPDNKHVILADTKKLIRQLKQDNPSMWEHAEVRFRREKPEEWLECTSMDKPRDMGAWTYNDVCGFDMTSGTAALIKLVQVLELPYVPITVGVSSPQKLQELHNKIGYSVQPVDGMKPVFEYV